MTERVIERKTFFNATNSKKTVFTSYQRLHRFAQKPFILNCVREIIEDGWT